MAMLRLAKHKLSSEMIFLRGTTWICRKIHSKEMLFSGHVIEAMNKC